LNSGKLLENLVSTVEKLLLPADVAISTNECIYDDEGNQIAEFDIEIEGKIGSTKLKWLIECRDRPSQGPAPNSWIEQLVGRKTRFKLSKVIAVSTTGFAPGVAKFAKGEGIELRTVTKGDISDIADWFGMETMTIHKRTGSISAARINIDENQPKEVHQTIRRKIKRARKPFLQSIKHGGFVSIAQAFQNAVISIEDIYDDLVPGGKSKPVRIIAKYPKDDYFVINTRFGAAKVVEIMFAGEIFIKEEIVFVSGVHNYQNLSSNEPISSKAAFTFDINGLPVELSFHNLKQSGETHILIQANSNKET
jgi:hypothetical protein